LPEDVEYGAVSSQSAC